MNTLAPTGSGSSPWTDTFDIVPQFLVGNPDTSNFNRKAVVDASTGYNIITHEPDFFGLTKTIKYGNYSSLVGSVAHGYDKFLRVLSLLSSEATPLLNISLTRDFIGNILSHTEPANAPAPAIDYTYSYDGMNRLVSGEGISEAYDQLSNIVVQGPASYTYQNIQVAGSDQLRLATFNNGQGLTRSYTYDANGNPTAITNQFTALAYDNLNMLRQLVYVQTDNYWYNDAGLRVKKTENAGGAWTTTYTLFDGDNPLLQEIYTAAGRVQTTFNIIVGGRILAQYQMVYPSTFSVVYLYLDNLSSRRVVIDATDNAIDRIRYSAWGVATQDVGSDNVRSFTGKDYDASGLIYFNARYYDPVTGRFLTEDPSRKGGNWYAYCEDNPINFTDPTGFADVGADNPVLNMTQYQRWQSAMDAPPPASRPSESLISKGFSAIAGIAKNDNSKRVFTAGVTASGTISPSSVAGGAGVYIEPKNQALFVASLALLQNPLPQLKLIGLGVLLLNTKDAGIYGDLTAGIGGGISGSLMATASTFSSLKAANGPYGVIGGSGGEGLAFGGDVALGPKGISGATFSAGLGGGSFEGHARYGITKYWSLFGGGN